MTRPNEPPPMIDRPAKNAAAAIRRSHTPQPQRWLEKSPLDRSSILRLFEKYAIAVMIRKNPTANITTAANSSQPLLRRSSSTSAAANVPSSPFGSVAGLDRHPAGLDRGLQRVVVALVLVGVAHRERREGAVEHVALTDVARDRDRISGARVRLRE